MFNYKICTGTPSAPVCGCECVLRVALLKKYTYMCTHTMDQKQIPTISVHTAHMFLVCEASNVYTTTVPAAVHTTGSIHTRSCWVFLYCTSCKTNFGVDKKTCQDSKRRAPDLKHACQVREASMPAAASFLQRNTTCHFRTPWRRSCWCPHSQRP